MECYGVTISKEAFVLECQQITARQSFNPQQRSGAGEKTGHGNFS